MTGTVAVRNPAAAPSRFQKFKERHQNPSITIPLAIMRCGLSAPALAWYMSLRAVADWSTGILPPHATPEWLQDTFRVSRRQRLTREGELRRAGLFQSVQVMAMRCIEGRKRMVKVERTAQIFSEPQTSQNTNKNAGVFSVPFLSRLKNGTPNSLKNLDSQALKKGGAVTESMPSHRLSTNTAEFDDDSTRPPNPSNQAKPNPDGQSEGRAAAIAAFAKEQAAKTGAASETVLQGARLAADVIDTRRKPGHLSNPKNFYLVSLRNYSAEDIAHRGGQRRNGSRRNNGVHSGRVVTSHTHVVDNSPDVDATAMRDESELFDAMTQAVRIGQAVRNA